MKALFLVIIVAMATLFLALNGQAQYKGARNYFPKNNPAPPLKESPPPAAPKKVEPSKAAKRALTFKELKVDTQFYLLSDTNRVKPWKKVSATTAKNLKSGKTSDFKSSMTVRK